MIRIKVGDIFGRLTVISRSSNNKHNKPVWKCVCECGKTTEVVAQSLKEGLTKSCGCFQKQRTKEVRTTHGKTNSAEFRVWFRIKQRCYNESHQSYKYYGGRGIKMSEDWLNSFQSFLNDMGKRPSKNYTIERVDVNGNYCKENCIWTDDTNLQAFNKKTQVNNKSGKSGVFFYERLGKWESAIWVKGCKIHLGLHDSFEEALRIREEAEMKYYGFRKDNQE